MKHCGVDHSVLGADAFDLCLDHHSQTLQWLLDAFVQLLQDSHVVFVHPSLHLSLLMRAVDRQWLHHPLALPMHSLRHI
jgi:hypothetical protein